MTSAPNTSAPASLATLTSEQWDQYQHDGYIIVNDLFAPEQVRQMVAECDAIRHGEYGDLYAGSAQIEPDVAKAAKDNPDVANTARKFSAVIERSAIYRKLLLESRIVDIIRDILGPDVMLFRDILMMKPAKVGSKMPWHQDSNYWPVRPTDLCSVWTALDEATIENGCMRVIPESHKLDLIASKKAGGASELLDEQVDLSKAIDVPLKPGSSLFFHSRLLHGSEPNHSDRSRRAFITSFMSSQSTQLETRSRIRYLRVCGKSYPGCVLASDEI